MNFDERPLATALFVDGPSDQFFSRTALSQDQNGGAVGSCFRDQGLYLGHRLTPVENAGFAGQCGDGGIGKHGIARKRLSNDVEHLVRLERLEQKSRAPSRIASTASGTVPCAVNMTTACSDHLLVIAVRSCIPSIPGIRRSVTTTS